jgi:hypothetical protein
MAQDRELNPTPQFSEAAVRRREAERDLPSHESRDVFLAEIKAHTRALEGFFDEEKYPVEEKNFLYKKTQLYQLKDPAMVQDRVETKQRIAQILRLEKDAPIARRAALEKEKLELLARLEVRNAQLSLDEDKSGRLADSKKNRLRTNWVNYVLGEAQNVARDFSAERLGADCGFAAILKEAGILQLRFKDLIKREKSLEAQLEEIDSFDPRVKEGATDLQRELQAVYRHKREFVTSVLGVFKDRCIQLMRDLRHRLLGEHLEV